MAANKKKKNTPKEKSGNKKTAQPYSRGRKAKPAVKKAASPKKPRRKALPPKKIKTGIFPQKIPAPELGRFPGNPIILPDKSTPWEAKATFNPTAAIYDGIVHLLYRAIGETDVSVLGYATSADGFHFQKKSRRAAYAHTGTAASDKGTLPVFYESGGGWSGGCEDPRLVIIGDTAYMTYTAFDGWSSVRIALTSIPLSDFLSGAWNWKAPVLISPPGQLNKNWVLFPEKIKGKYAILHSISPHILIAYVDDFNQFDGKTFIQSVHRDSPSWQLRDRHVRGAGPAPLKTKYGWLLIYHGTEEKDSGRYKLWAMLLDSADPAKILYRSRRPILEPEASYENSGHAHGIVYSCGAVIKDGTLFVYYGAADTVACAATANLENFLDDLVLSGTPLLSHSKNVRR